MAFISSEGAAFSGNDVANQSIEFLEQQLNDGDITYMDYINGIRQVMKTRGDSPYEIQEAIENECLRLSIEL